MREGAGDGGHVWKTGDVARFLGISERMVQDLASVQKIPHVRIGRLLRFSEDSVRKWFLDQEQASMAQPAAWRPEAISGKRGFATRAGRGFGR